MLRLSLTKARRLFHDSFPACGGSAGLNGASSRCRVLMYISAFLELLDDVPANSDMLTARFLNSTPFIGDERLQPLASISSMQSRGCLLKITSS